MADWDDVARLAMALPDVEESTFFRHRAWKVSGKAFAWVRPLRAAEIEELADRAPTGDVLGLIVADEHDKRAVLESVAGTFTVHHFDGFNAVLVRLDGIEDGDLADLVVDAWLAKAPRALAAQYLEAHPPG